MGQNIQLERCLYIVEKLRINLKEDCEVSMWDIGGKALPEYEALRNLQAKKGEEICRQLYLLQEFLQG